MTALGPVRASVTVPVEAQRAFATSPTAWPRDAMAADESWPRLLRRHAEAAGA